MLLVSDVFANKEKDKPIISNVNNILFIFI